MIINNYDDDNKYLIQLLKRVDFIHLNVCQNQRRRRKDNNIEILCNLPRTISNALQFIQIYNNIIFRCHPLPTHRASHRPDNNIKLLGTIKTSCQRNQARIIYVHTHLYIRLCVCLYVFVRETMDNFLKGVWLRLLNREIH